MGEWIRTLEGEVAVGEVVLGQWYLPLGHLPLLLQLEVGEDGDEDDEDNEAHGRPHEESEPSGEKAGRTTAPAARLGRPSARLQGPHLAETTLLYQSIN